MSTYHSVQYITSPVRPLFFADDPGLLLLIFFPVDFAKGIALIKDFLCGTA
jgi:hypothetical protein